MALVAIVLGVAAVAIERSMQSHLLAQVDDQLHGVGPQLGGLRPPPDGTAKADGTDDSSSARPPRLSPLYVGRITAKGVQTTLAAPNYTGDTPAIPVIGERAIRRLRAGDAVSVPSDTDGIRYRVVARAEGIRGGLIVVALPLRDVDDAVHSLEGVEAIAVLAVLAVLGLVTWWVVRLGIRPVRKMTETAGAIAGGDLSQRIPESHPGTEAGDLGVALNSMLGRIEEAFDQRTASEDRLRRFIADASHELRTPVTTIRGYAELYRTGALAKGSDLDEAMRRTEQESIRMGSLVDDLLHLARLDQGRPLERAPVDLAALARDAALDAQAVEPERTIRVEAPAPVVVHGDESRLRQVVANLVGNALVHAPGAAIELQVTRTATTAVLEVRDAGPGMAERDAAKAFERFYRADASRQRHRGGSGLGLAIVEATVRAHGGTVSIDTAPGHGTLVRAELPLGPAATPASSSPTSSSSPSSSPPSSPSSSPSSPSSPASPSSPPDAS
jgi:two-component system OmpR family sensor kinase